MNYEEGCMFKWAHVWMCVCVCVRAPPTFLEQCMSPSGVAPRHLILQTEASQLRNLQETLHKKKQPED